MTPVSMDPTWTDSGQGDLLELVAMGSPATLSAEDEWQEWLSAARYVARSNGGVLDPNRLRELIRGVVSPKRAGAFCSRAIARGLMVPAGWETSTDREGRNAGRPMRSYRWIGETAVTS